MAGKTDSTEQVWNKIEQRGQPEVLKEILANKYVLECIEAFEYSNGPLNTASDAVKDGVRASIHEARHQVMQKTGLEPEEFYNRIMYIATPRMGIADKISTSAYLSCPSNAKVQKIIDITKQVLEDDPSINNDGVWGRVLAEVGGNRKSLGEIFSSKTNVVYSQFISQRRFAAAAKILAKSEIIDKKDYDCLSQKVGVRTSKSGFLNIFYNSTGLSPIEFQKNIHEKADELLGEYAEIYNDAVNKGEGEDDAFDSVRLDVLEDEENILNTTCLDVDEFLDKLRERVNSPDYQYDLEDNEDYQYDLEDNKDYQYDLEDNKDYTM